MEASKNYNMIDFPKLVSLYLEDKKDDYKNFPIDLFPPQVSNYMLELRDKVGCNPNYMAGAFLNAGSICIGRSKGLYLRNTWKEHAVFWAIIIGEPGSKKTPSTAPFFAPIKKIQSDLLKEWKEKLKAHSPDVSEEKPSEPTMYVGDATIEAYIQKHSQNLRGVAIIMDEISGLVANSGKYNKGSDIEKYLSAFSYADISSTRKGVGQSSSLFNPQLSIFGGIQPAILTGLMTDSLINNGFWDRFLFISGNFQTGKMTLEDVSTNVSNDYDSYIKGLYELVSETEFIKENGDLNVDYYKMNPEASRVWYDYNSKIEDMINDHSELSSNMKSAYSKLSTYFGRFVLLMHILDDVYKYPFQRLNDCEVTPQSVEKAIRLVKYFMFQYELISKDVSAEKEAKNILFESRGMTTKEKVLLLHSKAPEMSQRVLAKQLKISQSLVNKYLK
ncbi:DUF3987 domain-containing protein [Flavobacterium sp. GP15]|uniref:DUF3987 domain-containing protein n=1 Tax=Flavobacterium sp. GP15 TaxID=2758567 RepID=UPI00165D77CE|nr:DUF3987 domain-containing protein [Flavobacterium sp. GP15]